MKKQKKEVLFRHKLIVFFAKLIIRPVLNFKYRFKTKNYKALKDQGPYVILANHTVAIDVMLLGFAFPFNLYYFATENIFNLGFLSKLLKFAVNPIRKTKSKSDLDSIRKARRIIKQGGNIAIFPEGNITYTGKTNHFNKSIVKMVRLLKRPVITYRFEGLYGSNPRWSVNRMYGKSRGYISKIITYEQYKDLDDETLYQMMYEGIYTNRYDENIEFSGKNMAVGLERFIFMDLDKNVPFVNKTKGNLLKSTISDFTLEYTNYGYVIDNNNQKHTLIEMDDKVKRSYYNYYHSNNKLEYEVMGEVLKTKPASRELIGNYKIILNRDSIIALDKNDNSVALKLNFNEFTNAAIQGKNKFLIYYGDDTFLINFDNTVSPYGLLLTYQFYKTGDINDRANYDFSSFGLR